MLNHEQSIANEFNSYMRDRAMMLGYNIHSFSLDGQDRDVGADYVLSDASRFALVEFKYQFANLISEKHKSRRLALCQGLASRQDMREYHDSCHFVAWAELPAMTMQMNVYRKEICNRRVFSDPSGLPDEVAQIVGRVRPRAFVEQFFDHEYDRSLSLEEFNEYLGWVMTETSGATQSTVELIARDPNADDLVLVRLPSITSAHDWLQQNWPSQSSGPGPAP